MFRITIPKGEQLTLKTIISRSLNSKFNTLKDWMKRGAVTISATFFGSKFRKDSNKHFPSNKIY
jgi:hypothetical protein